MSDERLTDSEQDDPMLDAGQDFWDVAFPDLEALRRHIHQQN